MHSTHKYIHMYIPTYIPYKMNIWRQFNLVNYSFMSVWRILYWQTLLYFTCIGHLKKNLVAFNLVDFHNPPNRQNKFYAKFSSYMVYIHTCIHVYIHTYIYTYIHTYIRTYVRTYVHTYIHTHCMHLHIHIIICKSKITLMYLGRSRGGTPNIRLGVPADNHLQRVNVLQTDSGLYYICT